VSSFAAGVFQRQQISLSLLQAIRRVGEYKGKQDLFKEQAPQLLESLRQAAVIQSTESSNRIEGVIAPSKTIKQLVQGKIRPANRSEQEIAGYRDVLTTIHASFAHMPFTVNLVLQLHRDLYSFTSSPGGTWKLSDNAITEKLPDGTERIRFQPTPAFRTPAAMEELHARFNELWDDQVVDRLLLIPTYILDFLSIHPFRDGNGRIARLLAILLLYKAGYEVGRYISLEKVVEDTREGYYDTLYRSSQDWHDSAHDLRPFWEYFIGVVLLRAYTIFQERVGTVISSKGAKRELILDAITRLPDQFRYGDVERACPGVSRPTIARALRELRDMEAIQLMKGGRDAVWEKVVAAAPVAARETP
jgi:Fic family protein